MVTDGGGTDGTRRRDDSASSSFASLTIFLQQQHLHRLTWPKQKDVMPTYPVGCVSISVVEFLVLYKDTRVDYYCTPSIIVAMMVSGLLQQHQREESTTTIAKEATTEKHNENDDER
jgi:hypothetical protein